MREEGGKRSEGRGIRKKIKPLPSSLILLFLVPLPLFLPPSLLCGDEDIVKCDAEVSRRAVRRQSESQSDVPVSDQ